MAYDSSVFFLLSLPVFKCSVVPYCIECIEGRGTQIESDERCYIKALIQNVYYVKPVNERWMPKQIAIIGLPGFVCADSTSFFGVSLLNCIFRSESRATHALVRCARIFYGIALIESCKFHAL